MGEPPAKDRLRVGVIGAGRMGLHHARAISRLSETARVVAVVDPSPEARSRFQEEFPGVDGFASLGDLIQARVVNVVHIVSPPETHATIACEALSAGLHTYIEKPFAESVAEVERIFAAARRYDLRVCAGHQLLFEAPTRSVAQLLPALGRIVHVESWFSFQTVRQASGTHLPLGPADQLLDILPHPVYLMLWALEQAGKETPEVTALQVSPRGDLHAMIRAGAATAILGVTLEGRPIESYLRIVGSRGSVTADYVRGTVRRHLGAGTSTIDKIIAPYREARQVLTGTTKALFKRVLGRGRSYPGLVELFGAFYHSIMDGSAPPVAHETIRRTVELCVQARMALGEKRSAPISGSEPADPARPLVLVTGGTGFLGRAVVSEMMARGWAVRVTSRREPPPWERLPGVQYIACDLADEIPPDLFRNAATIIHAAAETVGKWEAHQRNSIEATECILRAAAALGVKRFVHVSSLAVLKVGRKPLDEDSPLEPDSRRLGPYVWGKLESERLAIQLGRDLGITVKVVRPGALIDRTDLEAPGRLGRQVGNVFVAIGPRRAQLGIADVRFAARVLGWMVETWDEAPEVINLLDPTLPSRRELIALLKQGNPDLRVLWLPRALLVPLSWVALGLQRVLRPGRPAINAAQVFSSPDHDTRRIAAVAARLASPPATSMR